MIKKEIIKKTHVIAGLTRNLLQAKFLTWGCRINFGMTMGIIVLVLVLSSCNNSKSKQESGSRLNVCPNVKTVKAVLSNRQEELTLTGKVEYDPDKIINYVPLINGVVERTYFSLGDKVQKGQVLFDIRSTELTQLQADMTSLKSEEKIAERELKTAESLFESKMLSERELLEAQAQLNQCRAALQKTEMDMSMYGYNKVKRHIFSQIADGGLRGSQKYFFGKYDCGGQRHRFHHCRP